jgi:hypothetical protein
MPLKRKFKLADKTSQQSRIVFLLLGTLVLPKNARLIMFENFKLQTFVEQQRFHRTTKVK